MKVVTVPIAAHTPYFEWQLDLLWYGHRKAYGEDAKNRLLACVAKRNTPDEPVVETCHWNTTAPILMFDVFFDHFKGDKRVNGNSVLQQPLNTPLAVQAACNVLSDETLIEVLDCDLVHFKPQPYFELAHDKMLVCDLYETWHLKSKGKYKSLMDIYTNGQSQYYNGGFVPMVASVKTFKKLLPDWFSIQHHFNSLKYTDNVLWWAAMYALNAACERNHVEMIGRDCCYIPPANQFSNSQYITHYCCDDRFNKRKFPNVDRSKFLDNPFYSLVSEWLESRGI